MRAGGISQSCSVVFPCDANRNGLVCITAQYSANLARPDCRAFRLNGTTPAEAGRSQSEKETRQLRYSKLVRSDQPNRGNLTDRWGAYFPRLPGGWDGPNLDGGARDGILMVPK
jgi:hypothetical protein